MFEIAKTKYMPSIRRFVFSLNKSFYTWLAQFHITVKRPHNSKWSAYVYTYIHAYMQPDIYIHTYVYWWHCSALAPNKTLAYE